MILECRITNSSTPDAFDIFTMASALGNIIQGENLQVQGYEIVDFYDRYTKVSDFSTVALLLGKILPNGDMIKNRRDCSVSVSSV